EGGVGDVEDSEHELLAEDAGGEADAVVHASAGDAGGEAAFLDLVLGGEVDVAEDLDQGGDAHAEFFVELEGVHHGAAHADADDPGVFLGFEVDVAGAGAEADEEEEAEDADGLAAFTAA